MRRVILILLFVTVAANGQTGWFQLNSGTSAALFTIKFVNQNTGYCSGNNTILKTTNEGNNWFVTYASGGANLQFINESTGFATGGNGIIKTTNAGSNWLSYNTPFYAESIFIVDSLIGYGCASTYRIMKTFDGGLTWYPLSPGINMHDFHTISFLNVNTGFVAGGRDEKPNVYNIIRKTTNGGISWTNVLNGIGRQITHLFFVNQNTGFAIAAIYIYKTMDMGNSWSLVSTVGFQLELNSIYFPTPDTGFVVGSGVGNSGRTWATTNGGINWNLSFSQSPGRFTSVNFLNTNTGYVCGYYGTILKTTNGGITFVNPTSNEIPNQFSLSQNYPNPFNPTTNIEFSIAKSGFVNLTIYDATGREVAILVNEELNPGTYKADWDASNFVSGVYFYRLTSGDFSETKKMALIK